MRKKLWRPESNTSRVCKPFSGMGCRTFTMRFSNSCWAFIFSSYTLLFARSCFERLSTNGTSLDSQLLPIRPETCRRVNETVLNQTILYIPHRPIAKPAVALGKFERAFLQRAVATAARCEVGDAAVFLQRIVGPFGNP